MPEYFTVHKPLHDKIESTLKVLSNVKNISCSYTLLDDDFAVNHNIALLPKSRVHLRAFTDIISSYIHYHSLEIFSQTLPETYHAQMLLYRFEKMRIAVIASKTMPGVKFNIHEYYLNQKQADTLNSFDNKVNNLLYELYIKLEDHKIIYNQEQFAKFALKIINHLIPLENNERKLDEFKIDPELLEEFETSIDTEVRNQEIKQFYSNLLNTNKTSEKIKSINDYKIWTTKYDEIIKASSLGNKEEFHYLRKQLDKKFHELKILDKNLLRKLLYKLESRINHTWLCEQEYGAIDNARVSKIIANPDKHNIFKITSDSRKVSASITLLIDNSGSMRGKPIIIAAICAEVIAFICEQFNIKCEIVGFTTKEWQGGKSTKDWRNSGSPKNPGRISDLRYIIYKSFGDRFKTARLSIPIMLKEAILKENIDGEALEWAFKRLAKQGTEKKFLIVISDGAPLDEQTSTNNPPGYLDNHLKYIISKVEKSRNIKTIAFGIGHDVTKYYTNSCKIDDSENLLNEIIIKLLNIL